MSQKAAGIKDVFLAPGSAAFPADGVGCHGLGYSDSGSMKIEPFNPIKTKSTNLQFPTLQNVRIERNVEQMPFTLMKDVIAYCQASDVTVKAITSGVTKSTDFTASGGLFTFENTKSLGIDFELSLSPKERLLKFILERAFKPTDLTAIITASKTDTLKGSLNIPALDDTNIIKGYIDPADMFGTIIIADERLDDWKCSLKTKNTKSSFNRSKVKGIEVDIEGFLDGPDPDEILTYLAHEICPDIIIPISVGTPYNIVLKSGGCSALGDIEINDDQRRARVHITGFYDIEFADCTGSDIILQAKL
jgi:hypothetical protein